MRNILLSLLLITLAAAQVPPQVVLHWLPSTSTTAVSQTISRSPFSTACGAYTKLASVGPTVGVYTDATVVRGMSYCYEIHSVNADGTDGAGSVISDVAIPEAK
jgi:hypothetical protein